MQTPTSTTPRTAALRSFRITVESPLRELVIALLEAEGFRFSPEPFSSHCFRLEEEPRPLGSSLAAFFGYVYIQDRSSMLPPLALGLKPGETVLDMCASPGSKTGFAAQLVGPRGFVLANEVSHSRLFTLRQNLKVCNFLHAATCSYEGQALPLRAGSLSAIQLDPPCSGWGTVEKNPKVLDLWHGDKVAPLVGLQRLLLKKAAELLAPGGRVVYSTCTTNIEENERQVAWAEAELGLVREKIEPFPGFFWEEREGGEGTLCVDGKRSEAQGFYVARLKKPATATAAAPWSLELDDAGFKRKKDAGKDGSVIAPARLACATLDPGLLPGGCCRVFSGTVRFMPEQVETLLPQGLVWQGFPLGKLSGAGFQADARLRALMPQDAPKIVLERTDEIRALLAGQSRTTDLAGREAGLFWRDLPLGRASLRNGRIIASFQK